MSVELPWRPRSLAMKRVVAAEEARRAKLRQIVRVRSIEFTEAGPVVTSVRHYKLEKK